MERIRPTLADQAGVVARAQLRTLDLEPHDIRRLIRRRELSVIHPGVYLDHTGDATWLQRAWAAVLFCWPAALAAESAMRAADGPGRRAAEDGPIHVVISRARRVVAPAGIQVVRTFGLDDRVLWNLGPPRMRYDEAALDVALASRGEFAAIGAVARAVQSQHTTATRMRAALDLRTRAPRRDLLTAVLDDVAAGACSVLEHGYLTRVEVPHGLPTADRQQRGHTTAGVVYRDATYGVLESAPPGHGVHRRSVACESMPYAAHHGAPAVPRRDRARQEQPLATPNYAYEKRQRELAKKRKAEEKRQRKQTGHDARRPRRSPTTQPRRRRPTPNPLELKAREAPK